MRTVYDALRDHFGHSPAELPVVTDRFPRFRAADLQVGVERWLAAGREQLRLGVASSRNTTLGSLAAPQPRAFMYGELPSVAPIDRLRVRIDDDREVYVGRNALYLARDGEHPVALLTLEASDYIPVHTVQIMARTEALAEAIMTQIREGARDARLNQGLTCVVSVDRMGQIHLTTSATSTVSRDQVVLPAEILTEIERATLDFDRYADRLRRAGRHLRRGVLLHGPPGTGKTLTITYLASQMTQRSVFLVTDFTYHAIGPVCELARDLAPSMVVLEDIDLVGLERSSQSGCDNAILLELLNQMDGLTEDADVLFVLTSNRPGLLEPALAARPGRVDQAIEIALPDADCRRRLFELYARGLRLEVGDLQPWLDKTAGASAALIRELLRKAALLAAHESTDQDELTVKDEHLRAALDGFRLAGGSLSARLFGLGQDPAAGSDNRLEEPLD